MMKIAAERQESNTERGQRHRGAKCFVKRKTKLRNTEFD